MARKQLIRGANAARVEARIARVPDEALSPFEGRSIFGEIKALEEGGRLAQIAPAPMPRPAPKPLASGGKRAGAPAPQSARRASGAGAPIPVPARRPASPQGPAASSPEPRRAKRPKLRASDFTPAERKEILLCCVEYRNRLPTYLQSAMREVEIIDSIIAKCGGTPRS